LRGQKIAKKTLNLVKIAMDNPKPLNVFEKIDHDSGKIHQKILWP
jgi:hypothetical protein